MVLAMLSFGGSAAAVNYTADNVAIMRHVVCAPMTPMTLSAPHDSGTLLFPIVPNTPKIAAYYIQIELVVTVVCISITLIRQLVLKDSRRRL